MKQRCTHCTQIACVRVHTVSLLHCPTWGSSPTFGSILMALLGQPLLGRRSPSFTVGFEPHIMHIATPSTSDRSGSTQYSTHTAVGEAPHSAASFLVSLWSVPQLSHLCLLVRTSFLSECAISFIFCSSSTFRRDSHEVDWSEEIRARSRCKAKRKAAACLLSVGKQLVRVPARHHRD